MPNAHLPAIVQWLTSSTTETAVVDKPADEEDHGHGDHGHAHESPTSSAEQTEKPSTYSVRGFCVSSRTLRNR
jgi:hypothetical protein